MSFRHAGPWHYERIIGRIGGNGEWLVANESDDDIADFATEEEALSYIEKHNSRLPPFIVRRG